MTTKKKKEVEEKVPEQSKKEKMAADNFQSVYDKIITEVTKTGEKK